MRVRHDDDDGANDESMSEASDDSHGAPGSDAGGRLPHPLPLACCEALIRVAALGSDAGERLPQPLPLAVSAVRPLESCGRFA